MRTFFPDERDLPRRDRERDRRRPFDRDRLLLVLSRLVDLRDEELFPPRRAGDERFCERERECFLRERDRDRLRERDRDSFRDRERFRERDRRRERLRLRELERFREFDFERDLLREGGFLLSSPPVLVAFGTEFEELFEFGGMARGTTFPFGMEFGLNCVAIAVPYNKNFKYNSNLL